MAEIFGRLISSGLFGMINSGAAYIAGICVTAAVSYLIGSVNFTARTAKKFGCFPDTTGIILKVGVNTALGAAALDMLKGALCALLGLILMPGDGYIGVAAMFCLLGHAFPLFSKFRGGAGGAVLAGAVLVMNPLMGIAAMIIGFCMYAASGYVALGTVTFACIFPFIARRLPIWQFGTEESKIFFVNTLLENLTPILLALGVLLIYASSVGRIMAGDEPKIPLIKKKIK